MITLIIILILTVIAALVALVHVHSELNSVREQRDNVTRLHAFNLAEIQRLQTLYARKIDRALWMLVQVRCDRAIEKAPQIIRTPLQISIALNADLADTLDRAPDHARTDLADIIAEHLARRVAKTATTA